MGARLSPKCRLNWTVTPKTNSVISSESRGSSGGTYQTDFPLRSWTSLVNLAIYLWILRNILICFHVQWLYRVCMNWNCSCCGFDSTDDGVGWILNDVWGRLCFLGSGLCVIHDLHYRHGWYTDVNVIKSFVFWRLCERFLCFQIILLTTKNNQ